LAIIVMAFCGFHGANPQAGDLVAAAMVSGGLVMARIDPALDGLSDDELRHHLFDTAWRTLKPKPR
jgi:hypothetical protein